MLNKRTVAKRATALALWASAGATGMVAIAQDSTSRPLVDALKMLLDANKVESLAAEDATRPGHVVAALYIPGVQLLVIAGRCDAIEAIRSRIAAKAYRDVYQDLHACANADSRLFIHDMGADGLAREPARTGAPFDIVYEHMNRQTRFDGDYKGQDLSAEEYNQRFAAIDAEYARLLSVFVSE